MVEFMGMAETDRQRRVIHVAKQRALVTAEVEELTQMEADIQTAEDDIENR